MNQLGVQEQQRIDRGLRGWLLLVVVLILALVIRLTWVRTQTAVIENEGGEYARLADNLLDKKGYTSILGGPNLMYAPLYPILIAIFTLPLGNSEMAGRFLTVIMGAVLVVPMMLIARRLYGYCVALICGLLVAFHPLLIGFSAAVYNEVPYLTFQMLGVYFGLVGFGNLGTQPCLLSGIFLGLAYLIRPEAVGLAGLIAGAIVVRHSRTSGIKKSAKTAVVLLGAFLLVALPYVLFLSHSTGTLCFEGKSRLNYTIGRRMLEGMSYNEAAWGVGEDLSEQGPLLQSFRYAAYTPYPFTIPSVASYLLKVGKRNARDVYQLLSSPFLFGPLLLGFVFLALCQDTWSPTRAWNELFLLAVFAFSVVVILQAHTVLFRYVIPLMPFLLLWSAKGVEGFSVWIKKTVNAGCSLSPKSSEIVMLISALAGCSILVAIPILGIDDVFDLEQGTSRNAAIKEAGLWLGSSFPGDKTVMTATTTAIPYYAKATLKAIPYCNSATAIRYITEVSPDFLVLESRVAESRPFLRDWITQGVPSPNARLIYDRGDSLRSRVLIYSWKRSGPVGPTLGTKQISEFR
ncbi:MAG: glycosyltransferase family 39 protein [Acidobacteriota bacterium]